MEREESGTPTCALNSTLIGMYKGNVLGFMLTHTFIHLDFFVRTSFSGFQRTPCFSRKSTQVFVHEAPGVYFIFMLTTRSCTCPLKPQLNDTKTEIVVFGFQQMAKQILPSPGLLVKSPRKSPPSTRQGISASGLIPI